MKTKLCTLLAVAILLALALPAIGQDKYVHSPPQWDLLTERVDEHDQQICDLDLRLKKLEQPKACEAPKDDPNAARIFQLQRRIEVLESSKSFDVAEAKVEVEKADEPPVQYDFDGAVIVHGSERIVQPSRVVTVVNRNPVPRAVPAQRAGPVATSRRLKTPGELRSEIRSKWTRKLAAGITPRTIPAVTSHLVNGAPDHHYRYTRSQLNGLSFSELEMLHSIAHTDDRISPYTSDSQLVTVQRADFFDPTPNPNPPRSAPAPKATPNGGGCPNGRCPLVGGARAASSSRWFPGKILFSR